MRGSRSRAARTLGCLLVLSALFASAASAAEAPSRPQYVERAEQVCKQATDANAGILTGVETLIRNGELGKAAPRFSRAATALERTATRLAAIPEPAADRARIGRWLGFAKGGAGQLREASRALAQDRRGRVEALTNGLLGEAKRGNNVVAGFGFNYCRMNPNRFL